MVNYDTATKNVITTVGKYNTSKYKNENSILTVSTYLNGEYGQKDVYAGVPSVIGRTGVKGLLTLKLTPDEEKKFNHSCEILKSYYKDTNL